MTFRDRIMKERPGLVKSVYDGGVQGCPDDYGYEECDGGLCNGNSHIHSNEMCTKCWNREIHETKVREQNVN